MPVTKKHVRCVIKSAADEGKPALHMAPTAKPVPGLPPAFARILASADPRTEVIEALWQPIAPRVPKILKAMKRSLQGVGVLTTRSGPPSLIYFFTLEDGDPHFYRGYPPAAKLPEVASMLPEEFLQFYDVHDGWIDEFQIMGPDASRRWHPLGSDPERPSSQFLVVFHGNGSALLGFDLSTNPVECYTLSAGDDPPKKVTKVWSELDEWIAIQMEDFLPFAR